MRALQILLAVAALGALWILAGAQGWLGAAEKPGEIEASARPGAVVDERVEDQSAAATSLEIQESELVSPAWRETVLLSTSNTRR